MDLDILTFVYKAIRFVHRDGWTDPNKRKDILIFGVLCFIQRFHDFKIKFVKYVKEEPRFGYVLVKAFIKIKSFLQL